MIAAHPDDENTALIAELALGDGADVAYLSITRGEGGQNLIGPELQEGLGLIRSEELLAARRLDGARQFFTRATTSASRAARRDAPNTGPATACWATWWRSCAATGPTSLSACSAAHPPTATATTRRRASWPAKHSPRRRTPRSFPEHAARGLTPHRAAYLFQSLWRPPSRSASLRMATGDLDPLFGRSRYQIAMQSRSRHRSQDMGRAGASADVLRRIEVYEHTVAAARAAFNPLRGWDLAHPLASAIRALDEITLPPDAGFDALRAAVAHERRQAAEALRLAAGIVVDAVSDTQRLVGGEPFHVTVTLWNGGSAAVTSRDVSLAVPAGWTVVPTDPRMATQLPPGTLLRTRFAVTPDAATAPTEPYFLRSPRAGALSSCVPAS
jgi:hypothetical protein